MKRLLVIFMAVSLSALAFAGGQSGNAAKKELRFMLWDSGTNNPDVRIRVEYNDWFNAHNNLNVTVVLDRQNSEQTKVKLPTMMAAGEEPDLFHAWAGDYLRPYYEAGKLRSVSDIFDGDKSFKDQFLPYAINALTYPDGKVYGFPGVTRADMAYFNTKIFDQLGLKIPETFEELLAVCQQIKDSGTGIIPLAQGNKEAWPLASYSEMVIDRLGGNTVIPEIISGQRKWTDPVFVNAVNQVKRMIPYFPDGYGAMAANDAVNLFISGKAAIMVHTNLTNPILSPGSTVKDDIVVRRHPLFPNGRGDSNAVIGQSSTNLIISKSTKNADAAIAYAKGYYTKEWQQKLVDIGDTPTFKSEYFDFSRMPQIGKLVYEVISKSTSMQLYYDLQFGPIVGVEYNNVVQGIVNGGDPATAFARFQQFYEGNYTPPKK